MHKNNDFNNIKPHPNGVLGLKSWEQLTPRWDLGPVPRKFLGIVGQDPNDSKSNRSHVDIFRFCYIHLRYIL